MPRYFFDIKDGHRLVDPAGSEYDNDEDAIEKAKVLAIGVSLDKPAVDPKRHIAVMNGNREELFPRAGLLEALRRCGVGAPRSGNDGFRRHLLYLSA